MNYSKLHSFVKEVELAANSSRQMKDVFELTMSRNANNVAAIYYNSNGKLVNYKYKKVKENTYRYASIINERLPKDSYGSPVLLKVANGPHWPELFYAILMSGHKPLLIDARTAQEGAQNLIDQGKAVGVVTDDNNDYSVTKISLSDIADAPSVPGFEEHWENEMIFCSSGTTGAVKLMVYNGNNITNQLCASLEMSQTTKDIIYPKSQGDLRILAMIPFHHIFGFVAVFLWFTYYGKTVVYPRSNAANEILGICQAAKVTHVFSVPLFWDSLALGLERKLVMLPEKTRNLVNNMVKYNLHEIDKKEAGLAASGIARSKIQKMLLGDKIRFCISGGGYLNAKTLSTINGVGYNLYNGYGMTEIGVTSVELSPVVEDRMKASIGKPLHSVEYKIKKANPEDSTGELFVKSPITHIREIIGGVEKDTSFDEEGYFPTGDIAASDETGRYYIRGRIKDIIINADGENIFPDELEIFFKKVSHIDNLVVLGVNVEGTTNQKICLVVEVPSHISDEQLDQIRSEINEIGKNLPKKTKIDEVYLTFGKLPIANNMKIKRFVVRKDIENGSKDYININAKNEKKALESFDEETVKNIVLPLRDLFSKILILPKFKINDDSHWINDLGGDSMNYVQLILDVQEQFKVTIPESQYGQLTCINDFAASIAQLKKEQKTNK